MTDHGNPHFHEPTIAALLDEQVRKMLDGGHPIRDERAFRADWRRRIADQERRHPGFLTKAAARLDGHRLTRCREVRGTHGISHIYDPAGTDPPPPWWNETEAERDHTRRAIASMTDDELVEGL